MFGNKPSMLEVHGLKAGKIGKKDLNDFKTETHYNGYMTGSKHL